jgi:hypothetical protein
VGLVDAVAHSVPGKGSHSVDNRADRILERGLAGGPVGAAGAGHRDSNTGNTVGAEERRYRHPGWPGGSRLLVAGSIHRTVGLGDSSLEQEGETEGADTATRLLPLALGAHGAGLSEADWAALSVSCSCLPVPVPGPLLLSSGAAVSSTLAPSRHQRTPASRCRPARGHGHR